MFTWAFLVYTMSPPARLTDGDRAVSYTHLVVYKRQLYAEVNACFVGKSLMYLHKIYRDSGYEETRKYAELKRIGASLPLQNALREYRATGKRRLLRELLLHKRFRLLDSLYRWR